MLQIFNKKLKLLYFRLRWPMRRRSTSKPNSTVVIKKLRKTNSKTHHPNQLHVNGSIGSAAIHPASATIGAELNASKLVRLATFNAALFSMAPAVPQNVQSSSSLDCENEDFDIGGGRNNKTNSHTRMNSLSDRPKGILKQSPLHPNSLSGNNLHDNIVSKQQKFAKSKLRVSINLPDNEISLKKSGQLSFIGEEKHGIYGTHINNNEKVVKGKGQLRFSMSMSSSITSTGNDVDDQRYRRTALQVLKELNADIIALQDVKAEEQKAMKPLSDLASALGMHYVFADSWAPEYGNAVLSKWPIKSWKVEKIFDENDIRNVLKATIDVPEVGEVNFYCTLLDHLDERWRMKQINAIIKSTDSPHILAGGLNSLDETDYSQERWTEIVKYYEDMGKPTPKVEVMKYLKTEKYIDAKEFTGECESVVMIAKGQSVQGTCKYGTRVDYLLSSPDSPYKFVPGSYSVYSSKGTSDHHIVKVDMMMVKNKTVQPQITDGRFRSPGHRALKSKKNSSSLKNNTLKKL
ncbi:hypothetical protein LIER_03084 [Lithospermum erythrorhizon]|uniref:Endonuclease/exonuclease/phosphatase domain-containing protein n=1 Tax=Lithospermum erythrorhizon TaxID=34254 RepID=A0AAV3NWK0_LITER